MDVHTAKKTAQ